MNQVIDISSLQLHELEARRRTIVDKAKQAGGGEDSLTDDELKELVEVCAAMRRKHAGPPKAPKVPKAKGTKKAPMTADDL